MKTLTPSDCELAYAVPGAGNIIDVINPVTGRSWYYGKDLAAVQAEYPGAQVVNVAEWCAEKARRQDTPIEWLQTTEEQWWEMLEVLPPAAMFGNGFLVGEASDHHAGNGQPRFQAYIKRAGQHYAATRPMTRKEFAAAVLAPLAIVH
jgi:hypothetical protein